MPRPHPSQLYSFTPSRGPGSPCRSDQTLSPRDGCLCAPPRSSVCRGAPPTPPARHTHRSQHRPPRLADAVQKPPKPGSQTGNQNMLPQGLLIGSGLNRSSLGPEGLPVAVALHCNSCTPLAPSAFVHVYVQGFPASVFYPPSACSGEDTTLPSAPRGPRHGAGSCSQLSTNTCGRGTTAWSPRQQPVR